MKIFFYIGSLEAGGAERTASVLCSYWAEYCDYQVNLISGVAVSKDFYPLSNKIKRISLNFNYRPMNLISKIHEKFKRFKTLRNQLKYSQSDVFIASCMDANILFIFCALFLNKKIIICEHNNYHASKSIIKNIIRIITYRFSNKLVLLTNRDIINYTSRFYPIGKIAVIPNPLGIGDSYIPITYNENNLLAVGRLCTQKAFHRLIELFPLLPSSVKLTIVGEGPLRNDLQKLIEKNNLESRISLVGLSTDITKYYKTSSMLLMTSIYEGLPMVINEANSFGLPVIAYDCPTGPRELISDFKNGFIIKENDASAFAQKVALLFNNKSLFNKMRLSSYESSRPYRINKVSAHWETLFAKLQK